jgi:isopropylmalate/homocitrate/citramalate synthase
LSKPWLNPGKWHVSPVNFDKEVKADFEYPPNKRVFVDDSTIRNILNLPGRPILPTEDFVDLARNLDALGVEGIALNGHFGQFSPLTEKGLQIAKAIAKEGLKSKLILEAYSGVVHPTKWKEELDQAVNTGAEVVELYLCPPVALGRGADEHTRYSEADVNRFHEAIQYVEDRGVLVSAGIQDTQWVDLYYVVELLNEFIGQHKVSRILFADSNGCVGPEAMRYAMKKIRSGLQKETPISVHIHNDYGLASASTIAAVTGGATYIDVSINGIGDKSGHASLGEAVMALEVLHGVNTGIRLEKLSAMCRLVEEKSGILSEPYKFMTGKDAFAFEDEEHVIHIMENDIQTSYLVRSIDPEVVGQKRKVVWGVTTLGSDEALKKKLSMMGLKYTANDVERIIEIMRQRLDKLKKYPFWLTDSQVEEICKDTIRSG